MMGQHHAVIGHQTRDIYLVTETTRRAHVVSQESTQIQMDSIDL